MWHEWEARLGSVVSFPWTWMFLRFIHMLRIGLLVSACISI